MTSTTGRTMADTNTFDIPEVRDLAALIPDPDDPAARQVLFDALNAVDGLRDRCVTEEIADEYGAKAYVEGAEATRDEIAEKIGGAYWRADVCQLDPPTERDIARIVSASTDEMHTDAADWVSRTAYED